MSDDLFWALAGLGAVCIAAVAAYNYLETKRRNGGLVDPVPSAELDLDLDVQTPSPESETLQQPAVLDRHGKPVRKEPSVQAEDSSPQFKRAQQSDSAMKPSTQRHKPSRMTPLIAPVLDEATDGMALFHLADPLDGARLSIVAQAHRRVGGKPVLFEGMALDQQERAGAPWAIRVTGIRLELAFCTLIAMAL